MYEQFLKLTGLANMNETNQIVMIIALLIISTILGFMTDSLLRSSGFGPIGNALIMVIGFTGGAILYTIYWRVYRHQYPYLPIAAPLGGAFTALVVLMGLKAIFKRG